MLLNITSWATYIGYNSKHTVFHRSIQIKCPEFLSYGPMAEIQTQANAAGVWQNYHEKLVLAFVLACALVLAWGRNFFTLCLLCGVVPFFR